MENASSSKMPVKSKKKVREPNAGRIAKELYDKETRHYFESIRQPPKLFIEVRKVAEPFVYLDLRNLIVLLIYETFQLDKWVELCVISSHQSSVDTLNQSDKSTSLRLKSSVVFYPATRFLHADSDERTEQSVNDIYNDGSRKHPSITVTDKKLIICGLSSVIRFTFKYICYMLEKDNTNESKQGLDLLGKLKQLLGFRGGCLQACAESSVWTRFCEVDMIRAVNELTSLLESKDRQLELNISGVNTANGNHELGIPEDLARFERHMSLPVKIHNFRKVIQDVRKNGKPDKVSDADQLCSAVKNVQITDLMHEYAEGPTLLLSDLILYPSIHVCLSLIGRNIFQRFLPLTLEWHDKVQQHLPSIEEVDLSCGSPVSDAGSEIIWTLPVVRKESLYCKDTSRYKPTLRQFTRQYDIDQALEFLQSRQIVSLDVIEENPNFDWSTIPSLAHPEGGNLPVLRQIRKGEQLASMAYYALKVYSVKEQKCNYNSDRRFRIVDFCSGGGHVGILVACLLPECEVILVENKDESLRRAQERVQGLGLSNVFFYQSNLDYFENGFDLGMALHACGTATDLVLGKCVKANASFVCCPCCYGAVQENHVLTYPRSTSFRESQLQLRHYFVLCHASDHTHDEAHDKTNQGKQCMAIVDTDRCLYAQDNAYEVKLCKIVPETASPKNHILVGISPDK